METCKVMTYYMNQLTLKWSAALRVRSIQAASVKLSCTVTVFICFVVASTRPFLFLSASRLFRLYFLSFPEALLVKSIRRFKAALYTDTLISFMSFSLHTLHNLVMLGTALLCDCFSQGTQPRLRHAMWASV